MKSHAKNHQAGFTLIEFIVTLVVAAIIAAMVSTYFGTALTQSSAPIAKLKSASNLHQVMENIVADYNRLNALNLRYKWKASAAYPVNSVVVPTTNNGHYCRRTVTTGTGTSSTSEPTTWPTAIGGTVVDGGVTWTESGMVWQPGVPYAVSTIVVPTYLQNNGHYYKRIVTTGTGTSGATEPAPPVPWPTTTSGTIVDGGVTWTEVGTILLSNEGTIENLSTRLPAVNVINATNTIYGTGYTVTEKVFIRFDPDSSPPNQETSLGVIENNILKVTIKNNDSGETLTELFTIR